MGTIFANEMKRSRFGLIIWCAIAGLIILFGMLEYPVIGTLMAGGSSGAFEKAIASIPPAGQLVFGIYNVDFTQPIGFYIVMYYWTGLVVFVHAMYTGASIISKESRDKTAEFLFTKPFKRGQIVWAKAFTGLTNIFAVGLSALVMSMLGMLYVTRDPDVFMRILATGCGMFFTQCVLMALGLLCAALFKTYRSGLFAAMAALFLSYCLMFAAQYYGAYYFISPMAFFEVSAVALNGLNVGYILLSAAVIAVCLLFTLRLYRRKTIVT